MQAVRRQVLAGSLISLRMDSSDEHPGMQSQF